MQELVVVVHTIKLHFCFRSQQLRKAVLNEVFIAEPAIKAFDVGILREFSWLDKIELSFATLLPFPRACRYKFRSVVDRKRCRPPMDLNEVFKMRHNASGR